MRRILVGMAVVLILSMSLLFHGGTRESITSWIENLLVDDRHVLALGNVYFDDDSDTIKEKIQDKSYFIERTTMDLGLPFYRLGGRDFLVSFIMNGDTLLLVRIWGGMHEWFDLTRKFPQAALDTCKLFKEHFLGQFGEAHYEEFDLEEHVVLLQERDELSDIILYQWQLPEKIVSIMISFAEDKNSLHPAVNITLRRDD